MWTIPLPLAVPITSKKDFSLNLNQYRNAHYQILNKAKIRFDETVRDFLRGIPGMKACSIEYVLYPARHGVCDVSNVCAVVDKFFSDTLVNAGLIPDDNYNVVVSVSYRFGGVDKACPRVEATITPIERKEENMQITLVQSEIEQALTDFISSQMTIKEGMAIKIELRATRGAEGFQANIDIVPQHLLSEVVAAPATVPTSRAATAAVKGETPATLVKKSPEEAAPRLVSGEVLPPEPSLPEPEVVEEEAAEPEVAVAEEGPVDMAEEEPVPEVETEAAAEEPAEEVKPSTQARSLFGNLRKPENA